MGRHSVERIQHDHAGMRPAHQESPLTEAASDGASSPDQELFGDPTVALYGGTG